MLQYLRLKGLRQTNPNPRIIDLNKNEHLSTWWFSLQFSHTLLSYFKIQPIINSTPVGWAYPSHCSWLADSNHNLQTSLMFPRRQWEPGVRYLISVKSCLLQLRAQCLSHGRILISVRWMSVCRLQRESLVCLYQRQFSEVETYLVLGYFNIHYAVLPLKNADGSSWSGVVSSPSPLSFSSHSPDLKGRDGEVGRTLDWVFRDLGLPGCVRSDIAFYLSPFKNGD